MHSSLKQVAIYKIENGSSSENIDHLAVEEPLELRLGFGPANDRQQKSISITMRTPGMDLEWATGFLFTEGIIQHISQIISIKHCSSLGTEGNPQNVVRAELSEDCDFEIEHLERHFYTSSSCGICGKASIEAVQSVCPNKIEETDFKISHRILYQLPEKLRAAQKIFEYTGGIHAAGLFNESGQLMFMCEDIGRHNALDKLIGKALKDEIDFSKSILLLSGRSSFELIQKASMAACPIVAAVGAPSSLAVQLAKEAGISLVGFLKSNHFNVYSGKERIVTRSM